MDIAAFLRVLTQARYPFCLRRPFDAARYAAAVEAACLGPDVALLPAGNDTEIGERGITLSGGQRARVALARAVYADADVVILVR